MLNTEQCWAALTARDAAADGSFVYAVRTSGVYCRPACPSRLPLRKNVAFYETHGGGRGSRVSPVQALPARRSLVGRAARRGDRPGLRADPRAATRLPSLAELADAAGISRFHFHRVFKQITGTTPREWGKAHRIGRFAELLDGGDERRRSGLRRRFRRQFAGL